MCYRYFIIKRDLAKAAEKLRARLEAEAARDRFNVPPGTAAAVVRQASDGDRSVAFLRWGLVPHWSRDPNSIGASLANARSETAASKPSFRDALRKRRCIIPASGFFEWETAPSGKKWPWMLRRRDGEPLFFAGLWESWSPPSPAAEAPLLSCTILTTAPNSLLSAFHDRMPVILPEDACDDWLDPSPRSPESLLRHLHSYPAEAMSAQRVSPRVNSVAHDDPSCLEPLPEESAPSPTASAASESAVTRARGASDASRQLELGL